LIRAIDVTRLGIHAPADEWSGHYIRDVLLLSDKDIDTNTYSEMVCLTSLPSHILLDITSYLDIRTLKYLSPLHSVFKEVCDIHLFNTISLPLSNPYLRSIPTKPDLATALEGYGWKDDIHQTNHLDASLQYLIPLLKGRGGYVKELSIDLKYRYHDPELDFELLTNPSRPTIPVINAQHVTPVEKSQHQDPPSELDELRLQASLIRQSESPSHVPHLARTFSTFPTLPAVRVLRLTIYESFHGYLPFLFSLCPNISELILEPHDLLIESPLTFPKSNLGPLPRLKKLRVEPMLDSLRPFVRAFIREGAVEKLVLGGERWTMDEELADAIRESKEPKRVEVGKRARKVLLASQRMWDEHILV